MRIDLKKLVYGSSIPFSGTVDLSHEQLYGAFPFQHLAQYVGEIKNQLGVLKLSGTIKALYSTCCARCLKPLDVLLTAQVDAVLSREGAEEDNVFLLTEDSVEVEDILVPELMLQVNMTYLCRKTAKGFALFVVAIATKLSVRAKKSRLTPALRRWLPCWTAKRVRIKIYKKGHRVGGVHPIWQYQREKHPKQDATNDAIPIGSSPCRAW